MGNLGGAERPIGKSALTPGLIAQHATLALFTFSLFLSAVLMFAVQPMAGKMLLPLVGGTPAGWIVAMAFFQVMLLAGYFYAHLLSRLPPMLHGLSYAGALALGCLFLPLHISAGEFPTRGGATLEAADVFTLLTRTLAVPFIALSATSSTLQRLFSATGHRLAGDPYFLYAGSNLGSFTGLLLYPFVFERAWGLHLQSQHWFCGYLLLIGASLLALGLTSRHAKPAIAAQKISAATGVSNRQRLEWCALAFFPSALLLAVTTHISTDIFSAPLLWVVPLSLYLLTFVVAFSKKQFFPVARLVRLQPAAVALGIGFLLMFTSALRMSWRGITIQLVAFTMTALMCHMLLAARRPLEDGKKQEGNGQKTSRLTEFYLMISLGGALGGVLNAFIFPVLLNRLIEYPVLLCLSMLVNPSFRGKPALLNKRFFALAAVAAAAYVYYVLRGGWSFVTTLGPDFGIAFADVMLFITLFMLATGTRTLLTGGLIMIFLVEFVFPKQLVLARRDFYGVLKVIDFPLQIDGKDYNARYLYHGTTTHGMQVRGPKYEKTPTTYFAHGGPVDDIFSLYAPKDVAVLGLGAGTMNCYGTKKNNLTFFEIDPAVVEIAANPKIFTFLSSCGAGKLPRIVTGDGRLALAGMAEKFDLVVLDAFSSDTIPSHLLTTDALKVYLAHLKPGGLLLFNLSNRYFDLGSVLARNASEMGLGYKFRLDVPDAALTYASPSKWFVMARPDTSLSKLDKRDWFTLPPPERLRPWTDDDTDLLGVLEFSEEQLAQLLNTPPPPQR